MPPTTTITVAPDTASPEQTARTARSCQDIGASVVRVRAGDPGPDPARLADTVTALREATELLVQLTTDRPEALDADPDLVSVPLGATHAVELHRRAKELSIPSVYEVVDLDQLAVLQQLLDTEGPPVSGRVHCELVLGAPGGLPGTTAALVAAVEALPPGATFSATGLGPAALPVLFGALSAGGHLRVGRADAAESGPARHDTQLVARAAGLARIAQRLPATPDETRALLGVSGRRSAGAA